MGRRTRSLGCAPIPLHRRVHWTDGRRSTAGRATTCLRQRRQRPAQWRTWQRRPRRRPPEPAGLPTLGPNLDRCHGTEGDDTAANCEQVTSADQGTRGGDRTAPATAGHGRGPSLPSTRQDAPPCAHRRARSDGSRPRRGRSVGGASGTTTSSTWRTAVSPWVNRAAMAVGPPSLQSAATLRRSRCSDHATRVLVVGAGSRHRPVD